MAINTETGVSSVIYNGVPLSLSAGGGLQYQDFLIQSDNSELRTFLLNAIENKRFIYAILSTNTDITLAIKKIVFKITNDTVTTTTTDDSYGFTIPTGNYNCNTINYDANNNKINLVFKYIDSSGADAYIKVIVQSNNTTFLNNIYAQNNMDIWYDHVEFVQIKSSGVQSIAGSTIRIYYQ